MLENKYYRKIFVDEMSEFIDKVWENTPKPLDKDCVYEDYVGAWSYIPFIRRQLDDTSR